MKKKILGQSQVQNTEDRIEWYVAKLLYEGHRKHGRFPRLEDMGKELKSKFGKGTRGRRD